MKNNLKKKVLYNPLGYFKRSKTYDWDETEYSPTVKEEIQKLLDEKIESPKNSNETENEIVSLRNIDSDQTLTNFEQAKQTKSISTKNVSSSTFVCLPQKKAPKIDIFLKFLKDFKLIIPNFSDVVNFPVTKISIGINTSKEPSPINGKGFPSQPNLLESLLGINNKLMISSGPGSNSLGVMPSFFSADKFYMASMQTIPYSFTNFSQAQNQNGSYYHMPAGDKIFMMGTLKIK